MAASSLIDVAIRELAFVLPSPVKHSSYMGRHFFSFMLFLVVDETVLIVHVRYERAIGRHHIVHETAHLRAVRDFARVRKNIENGTSQTPPPCMRFENGLPHKKMASMEPLSFLSFTSFKTCC